MNLTDIMWQNVFSKGGHSNICHAPFSSRTFPHPPQEVESMCPPADPGQAFMTASTNRVWLKWGYVTSEAMSQKCLAFPPCSLGMVTLLEHSHHTARKPEQHMERPTWTGTEPWPMATAELSADSPYPLARHANEPSCNGLSGPPSNCPSRHCMEQRWTIPSKPCPNWRPVSKRTE